LYRTSQNNMSENPKIYLIGIVSVSISVLGLGIWRGLSAKANPINQPIVEQQTSRASGFTMKAEAKAQNNPKTGKQEVMTRLYATGPMHSDEVIRMEGESSLIMPNGKVTSFGSMSTTFSDDLVAQLPMENVPAGSKVKITGFVHVYHREEIKSEREMVPDGSIKLYMNTGTVSFRKVPNSKPPQLEVECLDLSSVHQHALELLAKDKKTVSNRILLKAGKQLIERENLPYLGRQIGMEPYVIRQLIPKRKEPMTLVIPVQNIVP
jgi:hypothetical protein